jgi:hypothetical protein
VTPMRLLESGIPLSLLLDLAMGPESADLLVHERPSAQNSSLVGRAKPTRHRTGRPLHSI